MSVAAINERLEALAGATSKLRRSREMAQLWSEIRKADSEERRQFAFLMSERFAPTLSAKFEQVSGVDGPDFIKLVRSLIDMDGDDVRALAGDLARMRTEPSELLDEISVGEAAEIVDTARTEEGRQALVTEALEMLEKRLAERDEPDPALVESTLPEIPTRDATSLLATESVATISGSEPNESEMSVGPPRRREPEPSASAAREHWAPIPPPHDAQPPIPEVDHPQAPGRQAGWLESVPDGWKRRRALSAALRDAEIGVADAVDLVGLLERESDRRWVIGDLIERDLSASEKDMVAGLGLQGALRRRFEATHGGV